MILIAVILAMPTIQGLLKFFGMSKNGTDEFSHSIGYLIWQIIMCVIIFLLLRYGLRFQKKSNK